MEKARQKYKHNNRSALFKCELLKIGKENLLEIGKENLCKIGKKSLRKENLANTPPVFNLQRPLTRVKEMASLSGLQAITPSVHTRSPSTSSPIPSQHGSDSVPSTSIPGECSMGLYAPPMEVDGREPEVAVRGADVGGAQPGLARARREGRVQQINTVGDGSGSDQEMDDMEIESAGNRSGSEQEMDDMKQSPIERNRNGSDKEMDDSEQTPIESVGDGNRSDQEMDDMEQGPIESAGDGGRSDHEIQEMGWNPIKNVVDGMASMVIGTGFDQEMDVMEWSPIKSVRDGTRSDNEKDEMDWCSSETVLNPTQLDKEEKMDWSPTAIDTLTFRQRPTKRQSKLSSRRKYARRTYFSRKRDCRKWSGRRNRVTPTRRGEWREVIHAIHSLKRGSWNGVRRKAKAWEKANTTRRRSDREGGRWKRVEARV